MCGEKILLVERNALASKQPEIDESGEHPAQYLDRLRTPYAEAHPGRDVSMMVLV